MKRLVIILACLGLGMTAKSQMTKIHTFEANCSIYGWNYGEDLNWHNYFYRDGNTCYFYNWDFSLAKSITITNIPEYFEIESVAFSKHYFNNDDNLEIAVTYHRKNPNYNNSDRKLWIINEDGELIQDVGTAYLISIGGFHKNGNELRCMVVKLDGLGRQENEIYRCAGNGGNSSVPANNSDNMNAYPNPANSIITLPYSLKTNTSSEMHIYDIQGRLVKTINVGPHFNEIIVDITAFPNGIYIYECEGVSNRFVVE